MEVIDPLMNQPIRHFGVRKKTTRQSPIAPLESSLRQEKKPCSNPILAPDFAGLAHGKTLPPSAWGFHHENIFLSKTEILSIAKSQVDAFERVSPDKGLEFRTASGINRNEIRIYIGMNDHSYEKLLDFVDLAKTTRLNPRQEEEAIRTVKGLLQTGPEGISSVLEGLPSLPWSIGVNALMDSWPNLNESARKQLLTGIGTEPYHTDNGRRFRLSLGRAFLRSDPPLGVKQVIGTATEIQKLSDPIPLPKAVQTFYHVMIGKGKPWIAQMSLEGLSTEEIDALAHCSVAACFLRMQYLPPSPPFTQISLLRWLTPSGSLDRLAEPLKTAITEAVEHWSPRWQQQLRREVEGLPTFIMTLLPEKVDLPPEAEPAPYAPREGEAPAENGDRFARRPQMMVPMDRNNRNSRFDRNDRRRPALAPTPAPNGFDVTKSLEQIQAYVAQLQSELQSSKSALLAREEALKKALENPAPAPAALSVADEKPAKKGKGRAATKKDDGDSESLRQHNEQLEDTVAELRRRLEELTEDHEDQASVKDGNEDAGGEIKRLIGIKLGTDYAEYLSIEDEPMTPALGEHCRNRWGDLFEVLKKQGISITKPAPKRATRSASAA